MSQLYDRPTVGGLTVPYMVDENKTPINFKAVDEDHVGRCARQQRCGVCGARIKQKEPWAFVGPDDGRRCFADPWMHMRCARLAMQQCPFLAGRRDWRGGNDEPLLTSYSNNMVLYQAQGGSSHKDQFGHWHFQAEGLLWKPGTRGHSGF